MEADMARARGDAKQVTIFTCLINFKKYELEYQKLNNNKNAKTQLTFLHFTNKNKLKIYILTINLIFFTLHIQNLILIFCLRPCIPLSKTPATSVAKINLIHFTVHIMASNSKLLFSVVFFLGIFFYKDNMVVCLASPSTQSNKVRLCTNMARHGTTQHPSFIELESVVPLIN